MDLRILPSLLLRPPPRPPGLHAEDEYYRAYNPHDRRLPLVVPAAATVAIIAFLLDISLR